MSIFSSLTYLLKRASLSLYQTTGLTKALVTENEFSNKVYLFASNESSTINTPSYSKYLHHLIGIGKFTNIPEINISLEQSTVFRRLYQKHILKLKTHTQVKVTRNYPMTPFLMLTTYMKVGGTFLTKDT